MSIRFNQIYILLHLSKREVSKTFHQALCKFCKCSEESRSVSMFYTIFVAMFTDFDKVLMTFCRHSEVQKVKIKMGKHCGTKKEERA